MRVLTEQDTPIIESLRHHYDNSPPSSEWVRRGEEMQQQLKENLSERYPESEFAYVVSFFSGICGTGEGELTVKAIETVAISLEGTDQPLTVTAESSSS